MVATGGVGPYNIYIYIYGHYEYFTGKHSSTAYMPVTACDYTISNTLIPLYFSVLGGPTRLTPE